MTLFVDLDSLTTAYSLSTSSSDNIDDTLGNVSSTATAISTTITASSPKHVYSEEATRYIASLSDEELYKFEMLLNEKEKIIEPNDNPKINIKKLNNS